jgi:bile acid:Na+ symporter, BASS family
MHRLPCYRLVGHDIPPLWHLHQIAYLRSLPLRYFFSTFLTESLLDSVKINFDQGALWTMNIALAFVMFGVALDIAPTDFKSLWKKPKPVLVGVLSQFILLPAGTFLLVLGLDPYPSIALGMFMVAACPGGNISNFISHLAGGNTVLSVCLTAMATLLAIFMTPFNLQFWGALYAPSGMLLKQVAISPWDMVGVVALLLGLPLLLGMGLRQSRPTLAKALAKVFKVASLFFFVGLVFLALYKNRLIFMDYILYVFWIVLLHNLLAFLTGFSVAKIFGLDTGSTRSITIETGIQNSGLGLLLIFTFFDGMGGMALLAAFWGIWHMVSGLLLAGFWGIKPVKTKKLA